MNHQPLKIYLFYCSNCLDEDALRRSLADYEKDNLLKVISLPCSGKLELIYLLKAFESGADGAILVTCEKGECRYLEGNLRAQKRAEAVDALLEETGLGKGRMRLIQHGNDRVKQTIEELEDFLHNRV
jgi:coenzyme F420-reducing hydrogenase delta subunit